MTAEMEYSFLELGEFAQTIKENIMNKAVRVKKTVAEKIKKVYVSFLEMSTKLVENIESGLEKLIDLSDEKLKTLNDQISSLSKPEIQTNKAVLFTGGLFSKIKAVTSNWFDKFQKEDTPSLNEEDMVIPSSWDDIVPTNSIDAEEDKAVEEFVPEPTTLTAQEEVTEPTNIYNSEPFEMPSLFDGATDSVEQAVEMPKVENPISIEERIAQLLNRTESTREEIEETPVISQSSIMAKIQRANNSMRDKEARISSLEGKLEAAKKEIDTQRTQINGYEAVVRDLTVKNNSLVTTNDTLNAKLGETESEYQSKIIVLEEQVENLTKSKQEETAALNNKIINMETSHSEEIKELKERHTREIESLKETNDRRIESIYRTISEALGEGYSPVQYEEEPYQQSEEENIRKVA